MQHVKTFIINFKILPKTITELTIIKIYQSTLTLKSANMNRFKKVRKIIIDRHGGWPDC